MEYSPPSELCVDLEKPVATLETLIAALVILPPEASETLPERVAVMAWLRAIGTGNDAMKKRKARAQKNSTPNLLQRFITPPSDVTHPNKYSGALGFITDRWKSQGITARGFPRRESQAEI